MKTILAAAVCALGLGLAGPASADAPVALSMEEHLGALHDRHASAEPTVGAPPRATSTKARCREGSTSDRVGDVYALDATFASVSMNCDEPVWAALVITADDWYRDELWDITLLLDTDSNSGTGCSGFDFGLIHDGIGGEVYATPDCNTDGWRMTGPVGFGGGDGGDSAAVAWGHDSIGSPTTAMRVSVSIESVYDDADYVPDPPGLISVPGATPTAPPPPPPSGPPPPTGGGSFSNGRCQVPYDQTVTNNSVARLYRAYFERDADGAGLGYWVPKYRSGELCLTEISDYFAQSQEFVSTYGALGNPEFVRLVYVNVLGREPDAEGYTFWAERITYGGVSRGTMMVGFSESPEFRSRTGLA